ncbi:MAG TPA: DUF6506 family protein, partial [Anaerovoracaceae bacterium]|nr:DUF6506 family protein [Anaerovoracaceae bacterium]
DEGFSNIDLCGAFNAEMAAKVSKATGGKIDVKYTKYSPEDSQRMDELESLKEYGIILMESPLTEIEWLHMKSDEFNTTVGLVNSLESACIAAKKMVDDGIVFIEMCRWFDKEKAEAVIDAIEGAVPVGYCG